MNHDEEDLWVSVNEFVAEPVRWFLEVMDGHTVAITRGGVGFAMFEPTVTTRREADERRARSAHTGTDHDQEAPA